MFKKLTEKVKDTVTTLTMSGDPAVASETCSRSKSIWILKVRLIRVTRIYKEARLRSLPTPGLFCLGRTAILSSVSYRAMGVADAWRSSRMSKGVMRVLVPAPMKKSCSALTPPFWCCMIFSPFWDFRSECGGLWWDERHFHKFLLLEVKSLHSWLVLPVQRLPNSKQRDWFRKREIFIGYLPQNFLSLKKTL